MWMTTMQEEIEALHKITLGILFHYHKEERPLATNGFTR
jgi:hypothetical protein